MSDFGGEGTMFDSFSVAPQLLACHLSNEEMKTQFKILLESREAEWIFNDLVSGKIDLRWALRKLQDLVDRIPTT